MGTGQRVAGLNGNIVDAAVAHTLQVAFHALIGWGKERVFQQSGTAISTIGREHREIRSTFQDAYELAELLRTLLQELSCRQLGRGIVILRHVLVVVNTSGERQQHGY